MKKNTGFSLIELLIALAIVAILAAIAIPSYNSQIQKTRRSDAITSLTRAASMQERFYMRNNSYTGVVADLGGAQSPEGYYTLAVDITACPNGQPDGSCFTLTANPAGPQVSDTHCAVFTLSDTGLKAAADSGGVPQTDCW